MACRFIYFSSRDRKNQYQILRADLDGGNKIVLANVSNLNGLALDEPGNRLFFCHEWRYIIRYIDLRSMEIHFLPSGHLPGHPTGLAMMNNTLYLTTYGGGSELSGALFKAETINGSGVQMIADGFSYPYSISAHSTRAPQTPGNGIYVNSCYYFRKRKDWPAFYVIVGGLLRELG